MTIIATFYTQKEALDYIEENPLVEPLAFNSTRSHPFGYICQECGELKTQEAIARATVSRLEYSIRTDK